MRSALFNALPDALIVTDGAGRIVLANDACLRLFGYERAELVGAPVEKLVPAALRDRHAHHRSAYAAAPRERTMGEAEMNLLGEARDGRRFPVEIALKPLRVGGEQRTVASVRDVSETHLARRVVRRARYDAASLRIGRLVVDLPTGSELDEIVAILAETLGTGPLALFERIEPDGRLHLRAGIAFLEQAWLARTAASLGQEVAAGVPLVGPDTFPPGVEMPAGMRSGVIAPWGEAGLRTSGILVAFSLQEGRFDYDAVHFLGTAASLISAMAQRRAAEEQLAHAQRLDAVGRLTGGIAHDFNNLLTVVSGNLQLLEDGAAGDPEALELIEAALRAVDRGAGLTRKLLSFAGSQQLRPRALDLANLLGDLARLMVATLGERISLKIDVHPATPAVYADPALLDSALLNLVINARDAIDGSGAVTVLVRTEHRLPPPDCEPPRDAAFVAITVEDTGSGMSDAVSSRVFEPFFTTKHDGRGTGLGLSMVYGFAQQSGGTVRVSSVVGVGTRVTLVLPAARVGEAEPSASGELPVTGGTETLLVVEDDDAVRRTVVASLRAIGYEVLEAPSADEALLRLDERSDVDLLFSDISLDSGMTGDELARAARAVRPGLKVLLTSGYENAMEATWGSQFTVLPKPYRREELAGAVRRELDRVPEPGKVC